MSKSIQLKPLFKTVAVLEFFYFAAAMIPPSWVRPVTGWNLNADGQWLVKLVGLALLTQAFIAWIFKDKADLNVAKALAFYQVASATIDWVMWLALHDDRIFDNTLAKSTVIAAIVSHYFVGLLLIISIRQARKVI